MQVKVLHFVCGEKMCGAEKLAYLICSNLGSKYSCSYLCGGDQLLQQVSSQGVPCEKVDLNLSFLQIINSIKKSVTSQGINIVHAHDNKASIYAYVAKKIFGLDYKIVSHIHSCYTWLNEVSFYKNIDRLFRNRYDLNISCGKVVYDYYLQRAPYTDRRKLKNLSNFIDVENIRKSSSQEVDFAIKKYNIDVNKFIYGFIGRLSKPKGLMPFVEELANHRDKFSDSTFLVVGSGEEEEKIKEAIKKYDMENLFIFTGYENSVNVFYKIIDVLFLPSLYEGLPMVLLEAMANSKPIVAMNVGSVSEVVKNGVNGLLIKSGDSNSFIDKLCFLKNNKEKIKIYSENGFKCIKENYDVSSQIIKIENLYEDLLCSNKTEYKAV